MNNYVKCFTTASYGDCRCAMPQSLTQLSRADNGTSPGLRHMKSNPQGRGMVLFSLRRCHPPLRPDAQAPAHRTPAVKYCRVMETISHHATGPGMVSNSCMCYTAPDSQMRTHSSTCTPPHAATYIQPHLHTVRNAIVGERKPNRQGSWQHQSLEAMNRTSFLSASVTACSIPNLDGVKRRIIPDYGQRDGYTVLLGGS
jgi:hypothetical protein